MSSGLTVRWAAASDAGSANAPPADLRGGEAANDPFRPVRDQKCDPVAMLHTYREKRPGEGIRSRFERRIIEPLLAKYDRLGGRPSRRHLIDQIAQGVAGRAQARVGLRAGFTHNEAAAFRGTQRCLRRNAGPPAPRPLAPAPTPRAATHDQQSSP